uniref:Uncharacterized protein n=1 Tax=Arundo donax TaxID=35708 RepID=A0A0A9CHB8_ARUDO
MCTPFCLKYSIIIQITSQNVILETVLMS